MKYLSIKEVHYRTIQVDDSDSREPSEIISDYLSGAIDESDDYLEFSHVEKVSFIDNDAVVHEEECTP